MKNSPYIPKLQVTTDYGKFKKIDSNREINKSHLNKLILGIQSKNLLYLFPIVINKHMEIVDGQHRLKSAEILKLPIYFLVDNNITKADIAMVNSNRKAWAVADYVNFYADEGNTVFKHFKELKDKYPKLTFMSGARLLDAHVVSYVSGGSQFSRNIKVGKLNGDNVILARVVCDLAQRLLNRSISYAFNPHFMLDIKNAIIQSCSPPQVAADMIYKKSALLPSFSENIIPNYLSILKDILDIKSKRAYSSKEEVDAFLERSGVERKK